MERRAFFGDLSANRSDDALVGAPCRNHILHISGYTLRNVTEASPHFLRFIVIASSSSLLSLKFFCINNSIP